jgi:hypothetical protein
LPTGDEWEVAARGGLKSHSYPWGNTSANALNSNWVVAGGYPNNTTPVGTYPRNGFGLSDCAGNVLEMNWDTTLAPGDEVPTTLQTYVVRGGGWQQGYQPRIVFGYGGRPFGDSSDVVGFRLAKNVGTLFVEDFETTPISSWKLSANGGGIYQTTNSTAQSGTKSLKLGIGQYQGGQNDSWASAQLSFPKPITNGSVEMYIYTQSNSPFYLYPHLFTESKGWDAGVYIFDNSNTIIPNSFETLESQSTAQKITGWQRFKWIISNGKVELWIGDQPIGKAAYKAPLEGVEVSMTSYFVSNVSTYIDNVKVEIKNP